jgi:hypothetical protein
LRQGRSNTKAGAAGAATSISGGTWQECGPLSQTIAEPPKEELMARTFRFIAGIIALCGLVLQFWLMTKYPGSRSMAVTVIRFLSFFTIQTNILIVVCMLLPAFTPSSRVSEFVSRSSFRTAVMSYSAVVAIIYFVLLRNIGHDQGLERFADQVLHYVTPTMFFLDWLVWVPKGRVRWSAIGSYLIYPALYCAWTFLYGVMSGWYPYPFFNARRLDYAHIAGNFVGLTSLIVAIPLVLLLLDRALAALRGQRG